MHVQPHACKMHVQSTHACTCRSVNYLPSLSIPTLVQPVSCSVLTFACSGESGAGKTESAKLLVAQLMELSQSRSVLEQKIVQVSKCVESISHIC